MVKVTYLGEGRFEGSNGRNKIEIYPANYSPVELFLTGAVACSAVDVVELAARQQVQLEGLEVELEFKRKESYPKIFTEFHLIYKIEAPEVEPIRAQRWVLSSLETYCSTLNTLRATTKIYYSILLNREQIAYKEGIISGTGGELKLESFDDDLDGLGCCCAH
ncbi:MAG: OsmC family protein [Campylobacterales bacterium]